MSISMNLALPFWPLVVVNDQILQCEAQNRKVWYGGDWALESLQAAPEPIGVPGEWADYVYTLAEAYDEDPDKNRPTPEQSELPPVNLPDPDKVDWYPLGSKEIPYLAVIYRRDVGSSSFYKTLFPGEPDPGPSHIEPGTACGGALLSPVHVLTVCGCLMTMISNIHGVPSLFPPGYRYPHSYDIQPQFQHPKIYVTRADVRFEPDFMNEIDTDRLKWSTFETLTCNAFLQFMDQQHKGDDESKKAAKVNAELVVLPFKPAIKHNFPGSFSQWPPIPINNVTDKLYAERAQLFSIGMRQLRRGRYQFFSSISASATELKHCQKPSLVCNYSRVEIGVERTCFCPTVKNYGLSGGVIGWPIVKKGQLVGITASERDPTDGTVLAAILNPIYVRNIETYIGKNVLVDQNTPPPVYRSNDLPQKFFIYDYNAVRSHQNPHSRATNVNPQDFAFSIAIVLLTFHEGPT